MRFGLQDRPGDLSIGTYRHRSALAAIAPVPEFQPSVFIQRVALPLLVVAIAIAVMVAGLLSVLSGTH